MIFCNAIRPMVIVFVKSLNDQAFGVRVCHVTYKGYINGRIAAAAVIPLTAIEMNCQANYDPVCGLP